CIPLNPWTALGSTAQIPGADLCFIFCQQQAQRIAAAQKQGLASLGMQARQSLLLRITKPP
ncbi:MAG: hypothetical protein RR100_19340, partial [Comamonas sp.]